MNDIDYSFGNDDPPESGDNRSEFRLAGSTQVRLELESSEPDNSDGSGGRILVARTRDLSAQGLSVTTREPLMPTALLRAWIRLDGEPETFQLTVDVVWCQPASPGEWLVGLSIQDSDDTSCLEWAEAVARVMSVE
ncbi:PilZ domain-containing protein [Marinobacter sp.]|uniref:PilZ domain-containing protein n=1 Tax=Marinobacter sp. TaxID=50741 RepID=UPI002B46DB06|nr:PilZ domain-containing protein [Marinobacter sp.]HKK56943.1 PilZ domain-containing protein [Marinobacter sp.]